MKPYSYTISKPSEIGGVIRAFRSLGAKGCSLLISIFTAYTKKDGLQEMMDALSLSFPEAEISGMTSSVCIEQGVNRTEKIIILFEVFEKTYIHTICFDHAPGKEDAVGWAVMDEINKISQPLCGIEILASQSDDRFSDFSPFLNVLTHELPGRFPSGAHSRIHRPGRTIPMSFPRNTSQLPGWSFASIQAISPSCSTMSWASARSLVP